MGKYLGFPIIKDRSTAKDFQLIIDRLHSKLSGWKANFLNLVGKTTLAKSTLNSIPTHVMQYNKLTISVLGKIDQIPRNFVWGSSRSMWRLHLISWEIITKRKVEGELGLQQAQLKNMALLSKLAWRAFSNPCTLWAVSLLSKYNSGYLNNTTKAKNTHNCLWKKLNGGMSDMSQRIRVDNRGWKFC